jgi:hypothetical protein
MLGNQIDNIVSVGVNFIVLFESNAWHYKKLRWWPRIWHTLYVLRLLNSLIEYVECFKLFIINLLAKLLELFFNKFTMCPQEAKSKVGKDI